VIGNALVAATLAGAIRRTQTFVHLIGTPHPESIVALPASVV
jgi:hypothetical protein